MKQADLARLLGYDQSYVSLLERGLRAIRDVAELRRVARLLGVDAEELGLLAGLEGLPEIRQLNGSSPDAVTEDQRRWRLTRRELNRHRADLTEAAAQLYPEAERAGSSPVLTGLDWLWSEPRDFADITLDWLPTSKPPELVGSEPESAAVRPLAANGGRFDRYTQAVRMIDRPSLFVNRPSYRLLEIGQRDGRPNWTFGFTTYFDMADVCEGVAHELAAACLASGSEQRWREPPGWEALPFRARVGDPFVLGRRSLLPSIDTLTIRLGPEGPSFPLHHRSASNVALSGGVYHIMPAGVFQPSSIMPWDQVHDFDLWRNVLREYAEEFLGMPEADGNSGSPIDYEGTEPYRSLNQARLEGRVRPYCFGIGLDPLTLAGEILSVVVIEAEVYDEVFSGLVGQNLEGSVVRGVAGGARTGIPFTAANLRRLRENEHLAPAALACLDLTWKHRGIVLK